MYLDSAVGAQNYIKHGDAVHVCCRSDDASDGARVFRLAAFCERLPLQSGSHACLCRFKIALNKPPEMARWDKKKVVIVVDSRNQSSVQDSLPCPKFHRTGIIQYASEC